jgi:hypothetical protein
MGLGVVRQPLENYSITSVRVDGDTAYLTDNTGEPSYLTKQSGSWLLDRDPNG